MLKRAALYGLRLFLIHRSIQAKIFTSFLIVALLALVSVTWIWYVSASRSMKEGSVELAAENIEHANGNLEMVMKDFVSVSTLIAIDRTNVREVLTRRPNLSEYINFLLQKKLEDFINTLFAHKANIVGISVIGNNGERYHAGTPFLYSQYNSEPWFQDILEANGKPVFFKLTKGTESKICIGRSIKHMDKTIGAVIIYAPYTILGQIFKGNTVITSGFLVQDSNDHIVYEEGISPSSPARLPAERDRIVSSIAGQAGFMEQDGVIYVKHQSDFTHWTTLSVIPVRHLMKDINALRNRMYGAIAVALLVVLLVSIAISQQITRNLKLLRDKMQKTDEGNLKYTPVVRSNDEVGELSRTYANMMEQIYHLVEDIKRREQHKRIMEIEALQAHIRPHFLYNTLNTIKYLAKLQQAPNIEQVTGALINLLRNSLDGTDELTSIRKELDDLSSYADIQRYRFTGQFVVTYEVEQEAEDCLIPRMLLQPILENAIIHGIALLLRKKGYITIRAYVLEAKLHIVITDNGAGISEERLGQLLKPESPADSAGHLGGKSSGIGLSNVHERIRLLYGEGYGLEIRSQEHMYTTVEMLLPVIKADGGMTDSKAECTAS
ncbi:cache domain-containing sensor histidine kinase [Paenibacillus silvisoli]|uniref:cache domain-containing sensor histidine kinase n=1 Tax=Paenibacillus silvisoli TaxID=3110539 RepID=UPI002804EF4E|nr:histidine kinase [Paenibacillus silvisoli]